MDHSMSKTIFAAVACAVLLCSSLVFGRIAPNQKQEKPWTDWTQKEAEKILNSSAWAQAQVNTDTSEMFFHQPTIRASAGARLPMTDSDWKVERLINR
jgi:hypothetical protein